MNPGRSIRAATPADNAALLELTTACTMDGDIGLRVDRSPDFFALTRMEGSRARVLVAPATDGALAGCVAVAERRAYCNGEPATLLYCHDLKVHPRHRGSGVADELIRAVQAACTELSGRPDAPAMMTVLKGNAPMLRLGEGIRGLPPHTPFATLRTHAVTLLWRRRMPALPGIRVVREAAPDWDELAALWAQVAPRRQFAPVLDGSGFAEWLARAPGLRGEDYLLARDAGGKLLAFVALWDTRALKQMRVVRYSPRLRLARAGFNLLAPLFGASAMPPAGEALRALTAVHLCVPAERPDLLRLLLLAAYEGARGGEHAFFMVGLDVADPLSAALDGLWAQPTDVVALVTTAAGRYAGPPLNGIPLHFEIALV